LLCNRQHGQQTMGKPVIEINDIGDRMAGEVVALGAAA
jgi:hypothetical protein